MSLIEPRTLKGFRDYLPEAQNPREWLIETAKRVYRSYGFLPIDTPALEYEEGDDLLVVDETSLNGTFVNGEKLSGGPQVVSAVTRSRSGAAPASRSR